MFRLGLSDIGLKTSSFKELVLSPNHLYETLISPV